MQATAVQAFLKLIRFDNSLFGAFAVLLSGIYAGDLCGFHWEYLVAFAIVFLSAVGAFAFNDFYDFEVDKKNRRHDRPLVSGLLSRRVALVTGLVSFFLVLLLSLFLNFIAISFVLVSLPLFFIYSLGVKRIVLVKNLVIAYAYVATILFGSLVRNAILEPLIVYFATMAFIVGLALEVTLDVGDVEGDQELGVETISTKFGTGRAAQLSVLLYGAIMILNPLPFFVMIDPRLYLDYVFLLLIFIPVASYLFTSKLLIKDQSKKTIFQLKKRVFVTMQVGCVAYLVGVLF